MTTDTTPAQREALEEKTDEELTALAEELGLEFDDDTDLVTAILVATGAEEPDPEAVAPAPVEPEPEPEPEHTAVQAIQQPPSADTDNPEVKSTRAEIEKALERYVANGLRLTFPCENTWHIARGIKEDSGTIHQPINAIVRCAHRVVKPAMAPAMEGVTDQQAAVIVARDEALRTAGA